MTDYTALAAQYGGSPDDGTDYSAVAQQYGGAQVPNAPIRTMEEPTTFERYLAGVRLPAWMENIRGSVVGRVAQGMADPVVGAVQTAANLLPDATGVPGAVNKRIADVQGEYDAERKALGSEGTDVVRIVGNVLSPVNAVIAAKVPLAVGAFARAGQGALVGAGTAAAEPIADTSKGFWAPKAGQIIAGAATGAVLSPILGAVGDKVVRMFKPGQADPAQTDQAIADALKEMGQSIRDVPPEQLEMLRSQVQGALAQGKTLDPAAVLRKGDFEALGMDPTLGQVTRDPMQFAREKNLRGVEGIGEPLTARFSQQGRQLQDRLAQPAAGAQDSFNAGTQLSESLKNLDTALNNHVSGLYADARNSAGKDLLLETDPLVNTYRQVLNDFGDKVPQAIRAKFEALMPQEPLPGTAQPGIFRTLDKAAISQPGPGILKTLESAAAEIGPHGYGASLPGRAGDYAPTQFGPRFTFEDADKLRQAINAHVGTDSVTNKALGQLRAALNATQLSADASSGPFAPAVAAARDRFKLLDAVPALKAASQGSVAPDDFVRRFVINGKTNDVKGLAQVLQQGAPDAYQEARAQIADELKRAAFGENVTGDRPFAPERYMQTVRRLGADKLGAFFSPQEVQDILRVGRVGAYVGQAPNAAAVSTSNSNIGLINTLANQSGKGVEAAANTIMPGSGLLVTAAKKVAGPVKGARDVRNALSAVIPQGSAPLTEEQQNLLARLIAGGAVGGGVLAGRAGQ